MSHSTNSNVNFFDRCNLFFETKKGLYRHQSYDSKPKELLEKMFDSDKDGAITEPPAKTMAMMYDSDEDCISPKPSTKTKTETKTKDNTKDIIKTKPITKPKSKIRDSMYTRIKNECEECPAEFGNKLVLTTHSHTHNRKYLENTEYFDINSSNNFKEFYITY